MSDLILDGTLCESCGVFIDGDSTGIPRQCEGCGKNG